MVRIKLNYNDWSVESLMEIDPSKLSSWNVSKEPAPGKDLTNGRNGEVIPAIQHEVLTLIVPGKVKVDLADFDVKYRKTS